MSSGRKSHSLAFAGRQLAVNTHLLNELVISSEDPLQCSILILGRLKVREDGSCWKPQVSRVNAKALRSCETLDSVSLKQNQNPHLPFSLPWLLLQNQGVGNQTHTLCSCCSCLEVWSHHEGLLPTLASFHRLRAVVPSYGITSLPRSSGFPSPWKAVKIC